MKRHTVLSKKRAILSIILVCAMLVGLVQGTLSVSALTVPDSTVSSWEMTSDLITRDGVNKIYFSETYYSMLADPVNSKDGKVLAINARSNYHNHGLGRSLLFNNGIADDATYTLIALEAGKYTVSYKYYLDTVEDNFYVADCASCNSTIAGYNDGTSATNYELYFGVADGANFDTVKSKLVSKSNALFAYETAKKVDFAKYGWQNGTAAFVVTDEMVANGTNVFAMYQKGVGHGVYLRDIAVSKCDDKMNATDYGLISDFSSDDVLSATDTSSDTAAASSVNNATNSLYNNSNRFVVAEVEVPGAGTQSVMAISATGTKRAMPLTTGLAAKDYMTLNSGAKYQISFDFYNPNYEGYTDTSLLPYLRLTNLTNDNPIVSEAAIASGMVDLLTKEEIFTNIAANGYVKIIREFEVDAETTIDKLALYSYCANNNTTQYYIDNIEIVEVKNTAVFDLGNEDLDIDNFTATYGNSLIAPESDIYAKVANISGWRDDATGEVFAFGDRIPKEVTARYIGKGENAVFNAVYREEVTFDFDSNYSSNGRVPNTISGTAARLEAIEEGNNVIAFTQVGNDRHFLLYGQEGTDVVTALASYDKYTTYKITFDYKCTALGTGRVNIYAAMGVKYYAGSTSNALYKSNIIEVTEVNDDWQTATAYVMAPNGYDTNTAEGAVAFQDGKYIGLGLTGFLENETGSTVLFDNVTVSTEDYILGDLDNDAKIAASDLAAIRAYFMEDVEIANASNADVKKDGEINILDVVRLKKYLAVSK